MKVLVACEESQRVCQAFRDKGHEAYSCDILEPSGGHPEWHILGDAVPLVNGDCTFRTMDGAEHTIDGKWDLIIAHPPCTYLSNVATRQYSLKCNTAEKVVSRWEERARAAVFFMQFALADCDRIAVENPVGFMNSSYRKPDQIIHPYFFAESEDDAENYHEKRTCLWLKGLPQLERSNSLPPPPPMYILQGEKGKGKKIGWCEGMRNIKGGQAERAKARSKTFPGIAKAMAEQWGTIAADRKTEPTTEDSSTVPTSSKMEQVQPRTCSVNGRPYTDCCNCGYFKCTADVPQTERSNDDSQNDISANHNLWSMEDSKEQLCKGHKCP